MQIARMQQSLSISDGNKPHNAPHWLCHFSPIMHSFAHLIKLAYFCVVNPNCVFLTDHTGPSFFPNGAGRKGWFPAHPLTNKTWAPNARGQNGHAEHARAMPPLKLCWA